MTIPLSPTAIEVAADAVLAELADTSTLRSVVPTMAIATAAITAYLAQVEKEGWVMVPKEPTDEMYIAAGRVTRDPGYGHCHDAVGGAVYRAMLAAAQFGGE